MSAPVTLASRLVALLAIALAVAAAGCGEDQRDATGGSTVGVVDHVHGLGVNPADGALFIATHSGLLRVPDDSSELERVGESTQDTMGFTVIGPDHFLGSGHPGAGEGGPPHLGLIESTDAGRSWRDVSLGGEADFHVLRYAHGRVYAFNGLTGKLMLSDDGGETWAERSPPGPVIDLAVDPNSEDRIVASTSRGIAISDNDGEAWQSAGGKAGLLTWLKDDRLYLIDAAGRVHRSSDAGRSWTTIGDVGGQPVALTAGGDRSLYAALVDGSIIESSDGGASWAPR